ncbi:Cell wall protein phiA [Colletotrichum sidae]|uniref:Cell wall protein phiA n=1 Tax=Colletotrichum sidae TaxID=1347389 RepID=A0A4V3I3B9_9PEZI|nr:Cell wall protein phiA [Colletotrichum sidae]
MQFTAFTALASLVAAVSGMPTWTASYNGTVPVNGTVPANGTVPTNGTAPGLPADAKFQLMSLRSASPVHFSRFQAARTAFFLQLPAQNASCDAGNDQGVATFYLQDGGLYLYSTDFPTQQAFTDRSGMGQGVFGYTTGVQPVVRNGERTGFQLDAFGNLNFDGAGFLACPNSIDGAWGLRISTGSSQPAGREGCLGVSVRAVQIEQPVGCLYTQQ